MLIKYEVVNVLRHLVSRIQVWVSNSANLQETKPKIYFNDAQELQIYYAI